jgi:MoxR-like ATPase
MESIERISQARDRLFSEISKVLIGQEPIMEQLLIALLAQGHCLLTGVPGLGKTLLTKTLAQTLSLDFHRIQFTPDLMPADVLGTEIIEEDPATGKRIFRFVPGPVFTHLLLADEINRTPPKTQAALLEAMGEGQVTAAGTLRPLEPPFFVMATQNPIELEGTYPLPEAQLDRFLLNLVMDYLTEDEEISMVSRTTAPAEGGAQAVFTREELLELQAMVRSVPAAEAVIASAVRLVRATRPESADAPAIVKDKVRWGAGSRASQALILAGKARALLYGRAHVAHEDLEALALPVLRHRVIPNFHAEAEQISSDAIISELIPLLRA